MRRAWLFALLVSPSLWPGSARGQIFSPGELSRPHADLEGLKNCLKCHEAGERLSNQLCNACHEEIAAQVARAHGFHGTPAARNESCAKCHHDHRGRDWAMVQWPGGKAAFDHASIGFPLRGKHADIDCAKCHEPRRIVEPAARELAKKRAHTFLGLPSRCASCHFDEHRGQLEGGCETCHDERAWSPAPKFDHDRSAYRLDGLHEKVACAKCHPAQKDERTPADAFPAPKSASFAKYDRIPHRACTDCHHDPHEGKLGSRCTSCHSTAGWRVIAGEARDRSFHDKTRYPLRGGHAALPCASCHGPFPGKAALFKGLPFASCTDCHVDSHVGQMAAKPCDACHTVASFTPASFGVREHAATPYPLEGAHRAVPCDACHTDEPARLEKLPSALQKQLAARGKHASAVIATERFDFDAAALGRCDGCHRDPHAGQFAERACASCHAVASFTAMKFDHDQESRFPLTGKHEKAACEGCHRPGEGDGAVIYKPLDPACQSCHEDVHAGQFSAAPAGGACETCHNTAGFAPSTFDHAKSRFPLQGKHDQVACAKCHTAVEVQGGAPVQRFHPLPLRCEECHADFHRGAYGGPKLRELLGEVLTAEELAALDTGAPCGVCHSVTGWRVVSFAAHDRTSFPLRGGHARAPCIDCHAGGFDKLQAHACVACHFDPHGGELGMQCAGCHDENSWRGAFDAQAHRLTAFPLLGRHALIPCVECHPAGNAGLARATASCYGCHAQAYETAGLRSIDHRAAGFSTDCQSCHDSWRFRPASYPEHELCFAIDRGPHRGIACRDCHRPLLATGVTGACDSGTAACTSCHEHRCAEMNEEHDEVGGYECRDRKCYECHQFSTD